MAKVNEKLAKSKKETIEADERTKSEQKAHQETIAKNTAGLRRKEKEIEELKRRINGYERQQDNEIDHEVSSNPCSYVKKIISALWPFKITNDAKIRRIPQWDKGYFI